MSSFNVWLLAKLRLSGVNFSSFLSIENNFKCHSCFFMIDLRRHLTINSVNKCHDISTVLQLHLDNTEWWQQLGSAVKQARSSCTVVWPDDSVHLGELVGHGRVVGSKPVTTVIHSKEMRDQDIPVVPHHCQNQQQATGGEALSRIQEQNRIQTTCEVKTY